MKHLYASSDSRVSNGGMGYPFQGWSLRCKSQEVHGVAMRCFMFPLANNQTHQKIPQIRSQITPRPPRTDESECPDGIAEGFRWARCIQSDDRGDTR